jgi:hypothetical protein
MKKIKKLSKEIVNQMMFDYKTGNHTFRSVAEKYGSQKETVRYHWKRKGLKKDKKYIPCDNITANKFIKQMAVRWKMTPEEFKEYMKNNPKFRKSNHRGIKHIKCLDYFLA